jgi:hypothetical protein
VAAFPRIDSVQKAFDKKIQIILVSEDSKSQLDQYIAKLHRKSKMPDVPSITSDTTLSKLFPHIYVPHHVWIDEKGMISEITSGYNTTIAHVTEFLEGKKIQVSNKVDIARGYFDHTTLSQYIADSKIRATEYSSLITNYNEAIPSYGVLNKIDTVSKTVRNSVLNSPILMLYKIAFISNSGVYSKDNFYLKNRVILKLVDSSAFIQPNDRNFKDAWDKKARFSYEQILSLSDTANSKIYMQEDLNRFFKAKYHIQAKIERKRIVCMVLKRTSAPLDITTSGGKRNYDIHNLRNFPFKDFAYQLSEIYQGSTAPFVNETNLNANVDLAIKAELNNLPQLRRELQNHGLDIIEAERDINMLVISDH